MSAKPHSVTQNPDVTGEERLLIKEARESSGKRASDAHLAAVSAPIEIVAAQVARLGRYRLARIIWK
jgi:hypothetical protein